MTLATATKIICESQQEEGDVILCDKCGEPVGSLLAGDESYKYCRMCGWVSPE